jgi:hypothetical protein
MCQVHPHGRQCGGFRRRTGIVFIQRSSGTLSHLAGISHKRWGRRSFCVVCLGESGWQTTNPDGLPRPTKYIPDLVRNPRWFAKLIVA